VVTEVTVKLCRARAGALHHGQLRRRARKAGDAVAAVIAAGIIPAGLEMMDKPMTAAVEDFVHAGYDLDAEAILLCESDGTPEEVEEEIARMREVLRPRRHAHRGEPRRGRAPALLERRKNAFPASGRISPDYMCMDSTIPRKRLADILLAIQQMEPKWQLRCMPTCSTPARPNRPMRKVLKSAGFVALQRHAGSGLQALGQERLARVQAGVVGVADDHAGRLEPLGRHARQAAGFQRARTRFGPADCCAQRGEAAGAGLQHHVAQCGSAHRWAWWRGRHGRRSRRTP
jgi:FAD/FMN-containing dehydrogenase